MGLNGFAGCPRRGTSTRPERLTTDSWKKAVERGPRLRTNLGKHHAPQEDDACPLIQHVNPSSRNFLRIIRVRRPQGPWPFFSLPERFND